MIELPIINPSFEDGSEEWAGIPELKVAIGWQPWWHHTDTRPEFKIATLDVDEHRIYEGEAAQQWFTTYATHTAGIYQIVHDIPAGALLSFEAWVQAFTRDNDDNWRESKGRYRMRIGIDPYGGMDPESPDIAWSEVLQPYDAFCHLECSTEAHSDRASVWVWGQAEWRLKHNNAYVDSCALYYEAPELPEPPEGGVTREQVIEIVGQVFPGLYRMHEQDTMTRLAVLIAGTWNA